MNRIDKKFLGLKRSGKKALIVYLTAGFPNISITEKLILELSKTGVDIFELGMPFSDPLADGPVIQEASAAALKHKINIDNVFSLVRRLRSKINNPLLVMGYYNPILKYGLENFSRNAKSSGLDGVIAADLPIEEANDLRKQLNKQKIHLIDFIAPTTDSNRIKKIAKTAKGFIYYVSLTGVTGAREELPKDILEKINYLKKIIKIPICVGFGISNSQQFKAITKVCDGAIVGSAIIKEIIRNANKKDLVYKITGFVKNLLNAN